MSKVVFIGTFDPFHGGHIGQLMRAHAWTKFTEALILVDKNPLHKPNASSWQHRLEIAKLTMAAFDAPFNYKIMPVESSAADEIQDDIAYKITGIDSLIDNISDPSRWQFITRWPMIVLSIPGIDDSVLTNIINSADRELRDKIDYTYIRETGVPIMNYDFSTEKLSSKRVHSTYLRSGADTSFIPLTVQNYIRQNQLYS